MKFLDFKEGTLLLAGLAERTPRPTDVAVKYAQWEAFIVEAPTDQKK